MKWLLRPPSSALAIQNCMWVSCHQVGADDHTHIHTQTHTHIHTAHCIHTHAGARADFNHVDLMLARANNVVLRHKWPRTFQSVRVVVPSKLCVCFRLSEFLTEFETFLSNETEVGTVVQILEDLRTLERLQQRLQQQTSNGSLCEFASHFTNRFFPNVLNVHLSSLKQMFQANFNSAAF